MDPVKPLWVGAVVLAACVTAGPDGQPAFAVRASRLMAFPGQPVMLTATADGAADCLRVVWEWPNGTESAQEGDCPPYPTRWTRWVALTMPGDYAVRVRWESGGRVVGVRGVLLIGLGGE